MDVSIFKQWFFVYFVPEVRKFLKQCGHPPRALLLIDNAPSHANETGLMSGGIKVIFLPPNVTSLIQPMAQGVLENLRNYRRILLETILDEIEIDGCNLTDCLKRIYLKDIVYWIANA